MQLVQKNKVVYDGGSAAIIIDGIDSDNVYMVTAVNCKINADTDYPQIRVTKDVGGTTTAQSGANYKVGTSVARSNNAYNSYKNAGTDRDAMYFCGAQPAGNATGEKVGGIWYLHNFNNANAFSHIMCHDYQIQSSGTAVGGNYGQVTYYVAEAHNGLEFRCLYNGWDEATVVLYEMVP